MKSTKYILIALLLSFTARAQEISIFGKITDDQSAPLSGATIQVNKLDGTVTNDDGLYHVTFDQFYPSDTIRLSIRHLGFQPFDTTLVAQGSDLIVNKSLLPTFENLPDIEVIGKLDEKTIYEKELAVLDIAVVDNSIITLSWGKGVRVVRRYSLSGELLHEIELDKQFNDFHRSYTDRIHLLGDEVCVELYTSDTLVLGERYSKKLFHDLIEKCLFTFQNNYIFKSYSRHNKRATYYTYDSPGVPKVIFDVYDEVAAKTASSYFWRIVGNYRSTTQNPSEDNTAFGFGELGHELSPNWDGDLRDLIVSNELQSLVTYYLSVEARKIKTAEFVQRDNIMVFDFTNNQLHLLDNKLEPNRSVDLPEAINWSKSNLYQDRTSGEIYVIAPNLTVHHCALQGTNLILRKVLKLPNKSGILSKVEINDGVLYCLLKNTHNASATIKRQDIVRYVTNK